MSGAPPPSKIGPGTWRIVNRFFSSNTYLCSTGTSGGCFLVDPGTDPEGINEVLVGLGLEPRHVICTHGHFDHSGSASFFQKRYGASCYLHEADRVTLGQAKFMLMALKIPFAMDMPKVTWLDGSPVDVGGARVAVFHTPGHTPGSCLIQNGNELFTGDTLFRRGVGPSRLPGEDRVGLRATLSSLREQIPDSTMICPGHGECRPFSIIRQNILDCCASWG